MTTQTTTPVAPAATTPPKNGAHPTQPQQPVTPPVQSAPAPDPVAPWKERAEKAEQERDRARRDEVVNRRKWEGEKKTFGEKLKAADAYERLQKEANINETKVAKQLWGDNWYERLTAIRVNGGTPSADAIALEMEQRDQAMEKRFADREAERERSAKEANQRAVQARIRAFNNEATEFATANANDYPIFARFGSNERIAAALVDRIRETHDATIKRDPETNDVLQPGRVLTFKEAADALEADLIAIAEQAADNPKYQEKLRAKLTPAKTPGTVPPVVKASQVVSQGKESQSVSQPRRTLGNDLTGSTPAEPSKYRTEEQRTADALAAYERSKKA